MKSIPLHLGYEHDCDYLPGNLARMVYVSPRIPMDPALYTRLVEQGFRRSGHLVYRPYCPNCSACVPVRIPVRDFLPNRSQRRTLKANADLDVIQKPDAFDEEHYRLYMRYLQARHGDGQMVRSTREDYSQFVISGWGGAGFYEFRERGALRAVAVVDHLTDALSAVYTFFDPDAAGRRGLGSYAVLWQVEEARRRGLAWVYLGFWVADCRKMAYKGLYRPLQALRGQVWETVDKSAG
jgi:arginine-tRNA-protein transferase